jgi:hypothetical protein
MCYPVFMGIAAYCNVKRRSDPKAGNSIDYILIMCSAMPGIVMSIILSISGQMLIPVWEVIVVSVLGIILTCKYVQWINIRYLFPGCCDVCGYNLAGLKNPSRPFICPECGKKF